MSKMLRALLISAAATGIAAIVLKALEPEAPDASPGGAPAGRGPYVDADRLSDAQRDLLMREMEGQV